MSSGRAFGGTDQSWQFYGNASWSYHDGDWRGTCDGTIHDHLDGTTWNNTTMHRDYSAAHPPHWPPMDTRSPPAVGADVTVWFLKNCDILSEEHQFAGADGATYRAEDHEPPFDFRTTWSRASGLVLSWHAAKYGSASSYNAGELTATDAPS